MSHTAIPPTRCPDHTVILSCSAMTLHVVAAQQKMGTNYSVVELDSELHMKPKEMRQRIIETLEEIPDRVDTVLVAMGFCGGSWESIPSKKRVVIPKVDDCITLLLHTDDTWHPNLKECGHLYLRDSIDGKFSPMSIKERLEKEYGDEGKYIFRSWFASYTNADIIDTGVYDCHSEEYILAAMENADLMEATLDYVPGSNLILEKLVSGRWDQQFLIIEPGTSVTNMDFLM
ncbi:MAG: DUF1638 domain-containing protein [Bacillota bacterium]|nr:DUF1638 domain-containing protein [Bacillota bacterium]